MTVIATDGHSVAADSLMCYGTERAAQPAEKIIRRDGRIFAVSGIGIPHVLIEWFQSGADPEKAPKLGNDGFWGLLVVEADGRMSYLTSTMPYSQPAAPPFVLGSGGEYALGAMHAGATPAEAVAISCKLDVHCGGDIVVMYIDGLKDETQPRTESHHVNGGVLVA